MERDVYSYAFQSTVPSEDVEAALLLAALAAESLHGEAQVRLDAGYFFDKERRLCAVDASKAVGKDFNRLFLGFLSRECGADAFSVERVDVVPNRETEEVSA